MSGHGHPDAGADPHAGHEAPHDQTTSDDFPADEPHSPSWLPLLGGGLLLAAIFAFVLLGADDEAGAPSKEAAVPAAAAPAAPRPAQRPTPALRPGTALPAGHAPVPSPRP
jgi:hypothetical protein